MLIKSENESLRIEIIQRNSPDSKDYWDGNWLRSKIIISVDGFKGSYNTNLHVDDFKRFHSDLIRLKNNAISKVEFHTMEEGICLKGKLDFSGNMQWEGVAMSEPGRNSLSFFLASDNQLISSLIQTLEADLENYPLVGIDNF